MRTAALVDVLKVVTYIVACFLLAAVITPPLYEMGKGFAHAALNKDTADKVTWLADKADKAEFDIYFIIGLLLGIARYRTTSLWLPIGLHMAWVFSMKMFGHLATRRDDFPEAYNLYMGTKMIEGLIPIGALVLTGLALLFYLSLIKSKKPHRE